MTEDVIPVLQLGPILLVSVQTELNDRTAAVLQQSVLEQIRQTKASALLLDITALSLVVPEASEGGRCAQL